MMATTTTKPVNLHQLAQEIGGSPSLHARGDLRSDDEKAIGSPDVADATLAAAVEAHTADWTVAPPVVESEQEAAGREFRAAVETATSIAELKAALLGTTGPGAEPRRPA